MSKPQITHWNSAEDGEFSEKKMIEKLVKKGYTVNPFKFVPGTVFEEHTHEVDKWPTVTAGEFEYTIYGEVVVLKAGDILHIPKKVPHAVRVLGKKAVGFLEVSRA